MPIKRSKIVFSNYTAFIPKTAKAAKELGKFTSNKLKSMLKGTRKGIKKLSVKLNKNTANTIRSFTKRKYRK